MRLKLGMDARVELRWWWEGPPPGRPVLRQDPHAARLYLARFGARPELLPFLRRFLAAGSAGLRAPLHDSDLLEQLATAIANGSVRVAETPAESLRGWDAEAADEAPVERPPPRAPEPVAPPEEVCWPCLRAAASARALRDAASQGTPFVLQD
jgi:hypothetical protein